MSNSPANTNEQELYRLRQLRRRVSRVADDAVASTANPPVIVHMEGFKSGAATEVNLAMGVEVFADDDPAVVATAAMTAKKIAVSWEAANTPGDWTATLRVRRSGETTWTNEATAAISTS